MDYKQLRRILRERLDAPGTKTNENYMHGPEEPPAAVQELPVHDLPVNIAPLVGDELVEPPVNDAEFVPGNLQQLQHAASVLMQHVPPLQVQDFYHQLRRLITTSIRQQNRAGENANDMMPAPSPDQEIQRADQAESEEQVDVDVAVAENIRRIVRNQLDEHKVRQVVRRLLTEQYESNSLPVDVRISMLSDSDTYDGIAPKEFRKLVKGIPKSQWPDMANTYQMLLDDMEGKSGEKLDRAASGKTGSESELLKKISDKLAAEGVKMGVSAIRNTLGRFNEGLGIRYFFDSQGNVLPDRIDAHRETFNGIVENFNTLFRTGSAYLVFSELYGGGLQSKFDDATPAEIRSIIKELKRNMGSAIIKNPAGFGELGKRVFSEILVDIFKDLGLKTGSGGYVGLPAASDKFRKAAYEEILGPDGVPTKQSDYTKLQKEKFDVIVTSTKAMGNLLKDAEAEINGLIKKFADDAAQGFLGDVESIEDTFGDDPAVQRINDIVNRAYGGMEKAK